MLGIARKRRTAIRLDIYGGRALVRRERMPLAMRKAIWRTGRWHRPLQPRHHPAKREFLKYLLRGALVRDLCIKRLAPDFKIDTRTLGRWNHQVLSQGAIELLEHGRGRQLGARVRVNRSRVRTLITELDIGERELAGRRKRRHGFSWCKSDPSPTPLSRGREKDLLRPIEQILNSLEPNSWKPSAARFPSPDQDQDQDALRAAIKGRNGETEMATVPNGKPVVESRLGSKGQTRTPQNRPGTVAQISERADAAQAKAGFAMIYAAIKKSRTDAQLVSKETSTRRRTI